MHRNINNFEISELFILGNVMKLCDIAYPIIKKELDLLQKFKFLNKIKQN